MDREIARKLNGDVKARPAAYSTNETAAARLLRRLARDGMPATVETEASGWRCTIWRGTPGRGQRIAVGAGETRTAAIARAVLAVKLDPGAPVRSNDTHPILARGIARPPAEKIPECRACGVELPHRHRSGIHRYCGVCSWNRIKERFQAPPPRPA